MRTSVYNIFKLNETMFVGGNNMKIVNVKKFVRSIVIVLLIIFGISLVFAKGTLSHKEAEYKKLYVSEGDTLWTIAYDLQKSNDYYKNKDIRYIIEDMKQINSLKSSSIYVNQELMIPVI